jgi:hypothetical protein
MHTTPSHQAVLFQFCFDAINGNGTYDQDGHKLFDETQIRLAQTESLKSKRIAILGIILCASGAAASTVDDLKDLDFLVSTVRENYAGFDDKVTPDLEPQLATLTGQMREKAGRGDEFQLLQQMREWTDFFKDSRLQILLYERPSCRVFT